MTAASAQASWAALMGAGGAQDRSGAAEMVEAGLPAPSGVRAVAGRDQVTVSWDPVPDAIGYAVHRAASPDGPFEVADFGGGDVLAVPHGPFADTTAEPGRARTRWRRWPRSPRWDRCPRRPRCRSGPAGRGG